MEHHRFNYIYGPVSSWRLGKSIGIDPLSTSLKTCTYDCVYCQVWSTKRFPNERDVFVRTEDLIDEMRSLPPITVDYITFAGNGEPTLAKNLGEMIRAVRMFRKEKIAVITNASLIDRPDVREDLSLADRVEVKLDASSADAFSRVNRPMPGIFLERIIEGMRSFRKIYKGQFVIQTMFVSANRPDAEAMARLAASLRPDEIEINTPLRICAAQPLADSAIAEITGIFRSVCGDLVRVRSVYESRREKSKPFSQSSTERRRGKE